MLSWLVSSRLCLGGSALEKLGHASLYHLRNHSADFAHLIDTTARPRMPHPRHRTRSLRSSTLTPRSRPSRFRKAGASRAVCELRSSAELRRSLRQHAAQSTLTKSPGPRSSMGPHRAGPSARPRSLFVRRRASRVEPGVNRVIDSLYISGYAA
jgi:hypothetical protein